MLLSKKKVLIISKNKDLRWLCYKHIEIIKTLHKKLRMLTRSALKSVFLVYISIKLLVWTCILRKKNGICIYAHKCHKYHKYHNHQQKR